MTRRSLESEWVVDAEFLRFVEKRSNKEVAWVETR